MIIPIRKTTLMSRPRTCKYLKTSSLSSCAKLASVCYRNKGERARRALKEYCIKHLPRGASHKCSDRSACSVVV